MTEATPDSPRRIAFGWSGPLQGLKHLTDLPHQAGSRGANPQESHAGCVYFIRDTSSGLLKVGRSDDVWRRLAQIQAQCDGVIELLHFIVTDRADALEIGIHGALKDSRVPRSEWFQLAWPDPLGLHEVDAWIFHSVVQVEAGRQAAAILGHPKEDLRKALVLRDRTVEHERLIAGAIFHPNHFQAVVESLTGEKIDDPGLSAIWGAALALWARGQPVTLRAVQKAVDEHPHGRYAVLTLPREVPYDVWLPEAIRHRQRRREQVTRTQALRELLKGRPSAEIQQTATTKHEEP